MNRDQENSGQPSFVNEKTKKPLADDNDDSSGESFVLQVWNMDGSNFERIECISVFT